MDEVDREGRRMGRLVTLVLALAVLAERAAGRSAPVRWFVLALLRHAEAVVTAHFAETTGAPLPWPARPSGPGAGPADAAALADRLRLLAALLRAMLPPDGRKNPRSRLPSVLRHDAPRTAAAASGGRVLPAFDTS